MPNSGSSVRGGELTRVSQTPAIPDVLPPTTKDNWIITTSLTKPDSRTRKLIRSHGMRGKNTRTCRRARKLATTKDHAMILMTPQKIASELALLSSDIELKPYMLDLIYRAFTIIKPSSYTLETALVDKPQNNLFCFFNFSQNPAMVHSILFTAQAFHDLLLQQSSSELAQYHLGKTLYHLRQTLDDKNASIAESTMSVVVSLAAAAVFLGDIDMAEKHMNGLHDMVKLRGGLDSLVPGSMIEHKAQRVDFGLSLATGRETNFFPEKVSWSPHIATGDSSNRFPELNMLQPRPDPRLLNIWADIRSFSAAANDSTSSGVKMPASLFREFTNSIPSRLTSLKFDNSSAEELLRLSMLAYVKSILTPLPGFGKHLHYLADRLKAALQQQPISYSHDLDRFLLWCLFITSLSVFEDFDRDWIWFMMTQTTLALDIRSWTHAKLILRDYPWIDIVFDQDAERLFQEWMKPKPNIGHFEY